MTASAFSELGLSPAILKAVDQLGYEKPAPIQAAAIPVLLSGKDIIGQSHTGSGKTAAFGLPAVELVDAASIRTQVLILCPTRELALQVAEEIYKFAAFKRRVHSVPIYGGQSYDRQIRALQHGAQIVIGTPGRLLDHLNRGTLDLTRVKMVVLDEADEMFDMGFRDDIQRILETVPTDRQLVCFSATFSRPIQELILRFTRNPETIRIEHKQLTVPTVEQTYYDVRGRSKTEALTRLIDLNDIKLAIIFCNTKKMVDQLTDELIARGYSAERIHGDISQAQRERAIGKFRNSQLEFLIATDVAARGVDVENVEVVFNYDLPWDEEDYVHRIGRTGRAGRFGRAISLVEGREIYKLQSIERFTRSKIQRRQVPSREEIEEKRSNVFIEKVREHLLKGDFGTEMRVVDRFLELGFSPTDIACAILKEYSQPPRTEEAHPVANDRAPTAATGQRAFRGKARNRGKGSRSFRER
jgi:ATP-dependent RNA helicase DeaD